MESVESMESLCLEGGGALRLKLNENLIENCMDVGLFCHSCGVEIRASLKFFLFHTGVISQSCNYRCRKACLRRNNETWNRWNQLTQLTQLTQGRGKWGEVRAGYAWGAFEIGWDSFEKK